MCQCECVVCVEYMVEMFYLDVEWHVRNVLSVTNMRRTNYLIAAIKILSGFLQKSRFSIEILGQTKPSQTSGLPPLDS